MSKIWFITGASKGFGREWTEAALERGDSVAGTARNLDDVAELVDAYPDTFLPLQLDVTDHAADVAAVRRVCAAVSSVCLASIWPFRRVSWACRSLSSSCAVDRAASLAALSASTWAR